MEVPFEEGTKHSQGRRAVVSERASSQHAILPETWENIRGGGERGKN